MKEDMFKQIGFAELVNTSFQSDLSGFT